MFLGNITPNIQFKFKDRSSAARSLGEILKDTIKKEDRKNTLILAIPRAGVLTADIIAQKLSISNIELIFTRKLTDLDNKEQAIGAIVDTGLTVVFEDMVKKFQIPLGYLEKEILFQLKEIDRRKRKYSQYFQNNCLNEKIKDYRIILIIDDGIATGASMMVTAKSIYQFDKDSRISGRRVIVAAPVVSKQIADQLKRECFAEVITVFNPDQKNFHSVEQYHKNFEQVTDEEVINILRKRLMPKI